VIFTVELDFSDGFWLLVAVTVYVPGSVVWSAIVQGSFEAHGFVPMSFPPLALHVTVLLLTPVATAVMV
jgi:hypothetical protein